LSTSLGDLEAEIRRAHGADRHRLRRQLRNIQQARQAGKPHDRNLARLIEDVERSVARRAAREAGRPQIRFDDELPISARREQIAEAIRRHQVVVVSGETGSGKSTQLPKICLELGRGIDGLIGHTQPRRIAARSVASRVADELAAPLGREVGFKIRFTDATSPQTYVKLMTDGILLAELQNDPFLNAYDTIIIDEAHERSLNIDFLLGQLKRLLPKRLDLKLIITSATIDAERFAAHFGTPVEQPGCSEAAGLPADAVPVINVAGRTYPVEVRYRPTEPDEEGNEPDLFGAIGAAVEELAREGPGDVLLFMPTERDIHEAAKVLRGRAIPGDPGRRTEILPLYARLSAAEQNRVFEPHSCRRIVIATNVAESSLTVPGIRYVIDPGTARISRYSPRSQMQRLPIEPVSQASADQRKGRCGRIGPGICVRLYGEQDYLNRERYTPPEIQRTNLASVILQTMALRLGPIEEFPFLDPPRPEAIRDGYRTLFELGAIDDKRELTELGRRLSRLPVDPRIARIILAGQDEGCLPEMLIVAAALEVQDPRERPIDKQQAADEAHAKFAHEESDFLSWLKLWDFYHKLRDELSRNQLRKACRQNFLSYNRMREWGDVYLQLRELVEQTGLRTAGGRGPRRAAAEKRRDGAAETSPSRELTVEKSAAIHRAVLTGFLSNIAFRSETSGYTVAGGQKAFLWPGSALFAKKPKWIVAAEFVETTRRYVRTAAGIDPAWIEAIAGHLASRSYSEPQWDAESSSAVAFEKVSLFGLTIVPRRRVRYGPIDPARSRELMIRHGLVEGEFRTRGEFFEHNRKLVDELHGLQAKSRRFDLLRGDEARYEFYGARIPAHVYDGPRFEKWRRAAEREDPRLLFMSRSDLLRADADLVEEGRFPDTIAVRQMKLPLEYHLEPGSDRDGITLAVPLEALNQLDQQRLGWLVPGLLEEKTVALIKSLPKQLRTRFVPVPDTARQVLARIRFGEGSFEEALARELSRIAGEPIPAGALQVSSLPRHLRMNVRVTDAQGGELAAGREVGELRQQLGARAAASLAAIDDPGRNRDGITSWDFGELAREATIERSGLTLKGYPSLVDRGESVSLRLADTAEKAARDTRSGVRRLFVFGAQRELKMQVEWLPNLKQVLLLASTLRDSSRFRAQLADLIAERAFFYEDRNLPRTEADFQARAKLGRNRISLAVQDIGKLIGPLMEAYQEARVGLERATAPALHDAVADIESQFDLLTTPGFLSTTPLPWLTQYPRYFRAISRRLKKLAGGGVPRDQQSYEQIRTRWQACLRLLQQHGESGCYDPRVEYYRWMLEEFRVSLFAQELGTAVPVSAARLDEQWEKITRAI
jgi:ATP-dependent helicase HrpA